MAVASALVLLLILAALLVWWWKRAGQAGEEKTEVVVSVRVAKAETESIAAPVSSLGTIFPREKADVGAKISAQIKQMSLLKNKLVHAGDVIAVLESRDLQAQRKEAQAALNEALANQRSVTTGNIPQTNAQDQKALRDARAKVRNTQATYDRRRALFDGGGISKKELEASELDLTTAQSELRLAEQTVTLRAASLNPNDRALAAAKVEEAQQHLATLDSQLSYATIRAPITGIVTDQFQYQGEFAAAGAKLFTIADMSQVIVKANFADTVAAQLKVGDTAKVLPTDAASEEMHGQITLVSRATDPTNRTVEVWVTLANGAGQLRANGAAQVTVATSNKNEAIVIPTAAVTLDASNANEGTVMLVDDKSVAHEQKVAVGIRAGDKIEITSGVKAGDTVVIEGNYALPDGTKVEASEGEKPGKKEADDTKEEKDEKP
jgi:multidrug efflux pump subunit AcrA (membrane-fusion protein)